MSANVLLVEEHDEMRAALRDWLLTSLPAMQLCEARTMEEALRLAGQADLEFALVNAELSGTDGKNAGIEGIRELRRRHPHLPLILMSLHDSEALRLAALEAGADAFVTKRELATALRPILERLLLLRL